MATLLREDGTTEEVTPANGEQFTLKELQAFVEGYIELVSIAPDPRVMFVNENGWHVGMTINRAATALYRGTPERHDGLIVGPAVVMTRREAGED
jgi:Domain of unknown function (DUF3846)